MGEKNVLVWSNDSFLRWSDFNAESNPAAFEDSHSVIKYRNTWTINSEKIESQVLFFIENIQLSVEFHPVLSWVRTLQTNDDLLKHEQGHFYLAELIKRENLEKLQNKFHKRRRYVFNKKIFHLYFHRKYFVDRPRLPAKAN